MTAAASQPGDAVRPRTVAVPWDRLAGWVTRFEARHPETRWVVRPDRVTAQSADGTRLAWQLPIEPLDDPTMTGALAHVSRPWVIGVVLVRRGGFAVARLVGPEIVESKVGRRHVQGRSKAGGWSQQRFARRRDNQARAAFDAAAEHTARVLGPHVGDLRQIAVGGDRQAVDAVFDQRELAALAAVPRRWIGAVADPKRSVLLDAVQAARSVSIQITDPPPT